MREYEITYLISDNVPEGDLNKVTGKVGGYVASLGGKVLKEDIWGRRKLAYPIKKQEFATYVTINFQLPADKAKELEHNLKLTSKIIRHLMLVRDFGASELVLTKEDIAQTEEITSAIGGEKSFEAVEGETEESKDLMAVRGDSETSEKSEEKEEVEIESEKVEEEAPAPAETKPRAKSKTTKKEEAPKPETKTDKSESAKKPTPKTKKAPKKTEEDEADRLTKLDKELDDILGDEL